MQSVIAHETNQESCLKFKEKEQKKKPRKINTDTQKENSKMLPQTSFSSH